MTAMFKDDNLFYHNESCTTETNLTVLKDCDDQRDKFFNDIYLYSNVAYNVMCFVMGFVIDRNDHERLWLIDIDSQWD